MDAILIPIAGIVVGVPGLVAFVTLIMSHSRKMKELTIREKELEMGGDVELRPVVDAV